MLLPPGAEGLGNVISARNLKVEETWKPELGKTTIKPGDAFTRTIIFSAPDLPGMGLPAVSSGFDRRPWRLRQANVAGTPPQTSSSKSFAWWKPVLAVLIAVTLALLCYARLRPFFPDVFARFRPVHLAPLNPPPTSQ